MKIAAYQANAKLLLEAQRVIHQQNLENLAKLNRQADQQQNTQEIKSHWVKVNHVDVMA